MKKATALIVLSLFLLLPLLIAGVATAEAASYATPLPGEVAAAAEGAPEPFKIDLTPIFQAAIALIAALITRKLIPWIKSKTTEKQFANLEAAARVAVFAAEQLFGAAEGDKKLEYAIQRLSEQGFDLDAELLREAVESAVYDLNFEKRLDIREEAREARRIADAAEPKAEMTDTGSGMILLTPIEKWSPEMLRAFCMAENIPCGNCATPEEYVKAIYRARNAQNREAPEAPAAPEEFPFAAAPEEDSEAPVSEAE